MNIRRFQECNWLVRLYRYRWYLTIPFKWVFYYLKCRISGNKELTGNDLFKILVGDSQIKMGWYYTEEEIKKEIDKIINRIEKNDKGK